MEIEESLKELDGFIQRISEIADTSSEYSHFSSLVRSSLVKSYAFLKSVYIKEGFDSYFFATSFLRSIVEDIIILESIHKLPTTTRERLIRGIHLLEVKERIIRQWDFFQKYRPFQPVIDKGYSFEQERSEVQTIWRENGWPNFEVKSKNLMPPTIQLAQKLAPGILDLLYEFIYRLASSTVHFSPQTLLRMGWGNIDSDRNFSGTISVTHMANYYKKYCQIYGALLFTFYFEFFSDEIGSTVVENAIIANVRKCLLKDLRWPEMITFEEMNLPVPDAYHGQILPYGIIHVIITEMLEKGFINSNYEKFLETIKITPSQQNPC